MKPRTREQETAYRRALRARKKVVPPVPPVPPSPGNVPPSPLDVRPSSLPLANPQPVPPLAAPCQNCIKLNAALAGAEDEISRLNAIIVQQAAELAEAKTQKPAPKVSQDDAQALAARVVAAKVDRINSFGKGHAIGSARI